MDKAIRKLAEIRAAECSNGTLTLDQLGKTDHEACWLSAEDDYIFQAGLQADRDADAAEYHKAKRQGDDV